MITKKRLPADFNINVKKQPFLRAHSHQISYLYPTNDIGSNSEVLHKKAKILEYRLRRQDSPACQLRRQSRESTEILDYIAESRKEV